MSSSIHEAAFEAHIAGILVEHGGYRRVKTTSEGYESDFDGIAGVDTADLFEFIKATQAARWDRLVDSGYGGDPVKARAGFVQRLASQLDKRSTVDVLRRGVTDYNVTFRLAYFKPGHGLAPELVQRYEANILSVTRQLRYEPGSSKTIDLGLFVNGIPVATAELKNPLTGQSVEHAMAQYRKDRDPKNRTLKRVGMVHFAVDPYSVAMTTNLAGKRTRFLPFNQGHDLGAGNPPNPDGHRTAYLWERVWSRDAWMDILGRFIHVEKLSKGSKARPTVIFPRFHQWDAVCRLEADAKVAGAGSNYLVQHSAGSGKSNSIAWLAHRFSSLHDADDNKVFDKVVVITDRIILDRQLQDTIGQFEHAIGVVQSIDKDAGQLAEALKGEQARIIVTTLQKFPFVFNHVLSLPERTYAVIVDEAHSSQTGEAAKDLRRALGTAEVDIDAEATDAETLLADAVAARGRQPNLSFFAFTATPKGRTLELFGRHGPDGKHHPFHLYPMRQAIEERFIEDVLANYLTYNRYYHLEKTLLDDPKYETAKARAALARFVNLHPDNLGQRADIVVEHFLDKIAQRMKGKAKAMVVCSSRPHAVAMWEALRKHINNNGHDLGVLVAFSGEVQGLTETKANGFPESETATRFDGDEYRIMVVAEKFQTGFDQPKLVAMYVDKTLTGLAAVQALSRLNRTHPDKDGTFVLDFVNDTDDIRDAFAVYHGKTVAPPTDPNLMFDTRDELNDFNILDPGEMQQVAALILNEEDNHDQVHAAMQPAVERFKALNEDDRDMFRDALTRFVRVYGFLAQIVKFANPTLEGDYIYCRALARLIRGKPGDSIDLDSEVELTHLRHDKIFDGSISLPGDEGVVKTIYSGAGRLGDPDEELLSEIIARINERFGTDWTDEDRLVFDAAAQDLVKDEQIQNQAVNNDPATFRDHVFVEQFQKALVARLDRNEKVVIDYLDNKEMQVAVVEVYAAKVQKQAIVAKQQTCPIGDLLGPDHESQYLEYKSTLRWDIKQQHKSKLIETAAIKTIAGFANSWYGGTLLIGVADDGTVHGLEDDYNTFSKRGQVGDHDLWGQHLQNLIHHRLGDYALSLVDWHFHKVNGQDLARIHVDPSAHPIYDHKGQEETFWHRTPVSTLAITDEKERAQIIATRWTRSV
ncbi:MAG: DEAD/DEAH box helicase [Acidimicrobiia bacterium]|nr:DEAD/DEAH box helicase [Acidimicrobiia bacterium]